MATINPYLTFEGNCEEAFAFYKAAFGGEFSYIGKFKDMPAPENDGPMSESEGNKIMHVSLPIGKGSVLMGSDCLESQPFKLAVGNNFSVSINTDSTAEADELFNKLSVGGQVSMPMQKTFWGAYFGMFTDQYKINWMINFDEEQN